MNDADGEHMWKIGRVLRRWLRKPGRLEILQIRGTSAKLPKTPTISHVAQHFEVINAEPILYCVLPAYISPSARLLYLALQHNPPQDRGVLQEDPNTRVGVDYPPHEFQV
jgi:hypothetical protein